MKRSRSTSVGTPAIPPRSPAEGPGNPWLRRRVVSVTHNGGEHEFPGDTLFALRNDERLHMQVVDVDVQKSRDGQPVVAHDPTLESSTDGHGHLADYTAAELSELDAGYWWVPGVGFSHDRPESEYPYRGVRTGRKPLPPSAADRDDFGIPTLEQVFEQFPDARIDIDLKRHSNAVSEVASLIHQFHREDRTIVASFDDAQIAEFRRLAPTVATSPGETAVTGFYLGKPLPPGFQILQLPYRYEFGGRLVTVISPQLVARAHEAGLAVWVWDQGGTPGQDFYAHLAELGVDGILAARPSDLVAVLGRLGSAWDGNDPSTLSAPPSS